VDENNAVVSFGGMTVIDFADNDSVYANRPSAGIVNPEEADIYFADESQSDPQRALREEKIEELAELEDRKLFIDDDVRNCRRMSEEAYYTNCGPNCPDTEIINGRSFIAFRGTDSSVDYSHILNYFRNNVPATCNHDDDWCCNLKGQYDNFETGWNMVNNRPSTSDKYDVCCGHSLGGAIAKYHASRGGCKKVITFGAPKTKDITTPTTEIIRRSTHTWVKCTKWWWKICVNFATYKATWQDPVTVIGYKNGGGHQGIKYTGSNSASTKPDDLWYNAWKIHLHKIENYLN